MTPLALASRRDVVLGFSARVHHPLGRKIFVSVTGPYDSGGRILYELVCDVGPGSSSSVSRRDFMLGRPGWNYGAPSIPTRHAMARAACREVERALGGTCGYDSGEWGEL